MNFPLLPELKGKKLILASESPRRSQLLKLIKLDFDVQPSHYNEEEEHFTYPEVKVLELAQKKAKKVAETIKEGLIVSADTVVALGDRIFDKPKDNREAKMMLLELSGQTHQVYTGFMIFDVAGGKSFSDFEKTDVTFRKLDDSEIDAYIATGSPFDKAGAYGIQDESALFAERIDGCFYNIMGFPVTKFYVSLKQFLKS